MKLSRQFTVFGSAVFCVVIFSLYLMLDRGHFDHPKSPRREGTFPKVSGAEAEARRAEVEGRTAMPPPPSPGRAAAGAPRRGGTRGGGRAGPAAGSELGPLRAVLRLERVRPGAGSGGARPAGRDGLGTLCGRGGSAGGSPDR